MWLFVKAKAVLARAQWLPTWPDVWPQLTTKRSGSWTLISAARVSQPSWDVRARVFTSRALAGLQFLSMTTWVSCPPASFFHQKVCMRLLNFPSTLLSCFVWNALCSKEKQLRSILRKFLRYNYLQIILLLGQDKLQQVFFCKLIHITWNKDHLNFFLVSKESHNIRDILQWKTSLLALKDDMWFIW